ncbi:MAG: MBL fold metallo-hydrolase [Bacillales bacterium]|jgi:L-ascorbate metabolism protein UlaG (beta-lactamase superfamily)|nr:MBL fold metallo-hydrolase [Bacillales bacterium]
MAELLYQGHGSFRLTSDLGTVIYVDPFAGKGYDVLANLILITHFHFDHNQRQLVKQNKETKTLTFEDFKSKTLIYKDILIERVEAYNSNHKIEEGCGYIITIDNKRIYATGDTSKTKEMKTIKNIDYLLICGDGIYNMDLVEADECINIIRPKHYIPYHISPGKLFDKERAKLLTSENKLILEPESVLKL